ncbi:biotin--[acetyl-CoA-carboxylase] ligase [Anthocerotibacter panamensis]|uniref:biotin--[acetyl-CoA-carboxylase] ligase n=1 Tax=Anthocerotibacter panamensis TaxID=2857077 RepID=UPI001C401857|nr:biotin--[acetyl-CoA-carboxylase] ligase [Anthocerotibacter panamensis]
MSTHRKPQTLGYPLFTYPVLDSTNTRALELLSSGAPEGTTVLAHTQTAGRGQRGHTWDSSDGGVYLSVLLRPALQTQYLLQITLWSAWGVAWALRRQGIPVQLKWPNDLVVGGRKLGGMLTETRIQGSTLLGAVVGVGVNGSNQVPATAITLTELGDFDYTETCATVLLGLEVGYRLWQRRGFERIRNHYLRWWINQRQNVAEGTVTSIDALGRVEILNPSGEPVFYYPGQVQLGYPFTENPHAGA